MTSTAFRIAALCSLMTLGGCNLSSSSAPSAEARSGGQITGTFAPATDASNPQVGPDGTVSRLTTRR